MYVYTSFAFTSYERVNLFNHSTLTSWNVKPYELLRTLLDLCGCRFSISPVVSYRPSDRSRAQRAKCTKHVDLFCTRISGRREPIIVLLIYSTRREGRLRNDLKTLYVFIRLRRYTVRCRVIRPLWFVYSFRQRIHLAHRTYICSSIKPCAEYPSTINFTKNTIFVRVDCNY